MKNNNSSLSIESGKRIIIAKKVLRYFLFSSFIFLAPLGVYGQCDFPLNIPASKMVLWLCPDSAVYSDTLTTPAAIGDTVHEWRDISGHGWKFRNTRHNRRPVLQTWAGKTYLDFTPGDLLENTVIQDSINGLMEFSIFMVVKSHVTNTDNGFLYHTYPPDGQDDELCLRYDNSGYWTGRGNLIKAGLLTNDGKNQVETMSNTQATNRQVIALSWESGGKLYSHINGMVNDSSDTNMTGPLNNISEVLIGKGAKDQNVDDGWNGNISHIIFYREKYTFDTIQQISDVLPVELLAFNGHRSGDEIKLKWTVATEINNAYFSIEHSKNSQNWEEIGRQDGRGTSNQQHSYDYADFHPSHGVNYYRLKQVDYDGKAEYSGIIAVQFQPSEQAELIQILNYMGQPATEDYRGLKVKVYSDGTVVKTFK